jgi:acyl transferase domain-containing protein/acyl carrier protein
MSGERMDGPVVVGLDGRFPGADDPDAFWSLLLRGESAIRAVDPDRWLPSAGHRDPADEAGLLADADCFDPAFFRIPPAEARAMDPQQRLVLETAWRAVEDSGIDPESLAGSRAGVFVGVMNAEWSHTVLDEGDDVAPVDGTGNGHAIIANRVSYVLDLHGPSMAIDTACSSSLVALAQACSALRAGDCPVAIVAGVNVIVSPALGRFYANAGIGASGGCKPFDSAADGITRGEAVAALVLTTREFAAANGMVPRAEIRGVAVGHDGRSNGLTAPLRSAQCELLHRALDTAGIVPGDVVALECHGTGTVLGDRIEANALGDVFARSGRVVPIASVKGNVGHTEGAAGIVGLVKAVLALEHRMLPPTRIVAGEHPALDLAAKGLRLVRRPERLRDDDPVIGVSAFGLGGTNAHVLVGSAARPATDRGEPGPYLVALADRDADTLRRSAELLAADLEQRPQLPTSAALRTARRVRGTGPFRIAFVAEDRSAVISGLRTSVPVGPVRDGGAPPLFGEPTAGSAPVGRTADPPPHEFVRRWLDGEHVPLRDDAAPSARIRPRRFDRSFSSWRRHAAARPGSTDPTVGAPESDVSDGVVAELVRVTGMHPDRITPSARLEADLLLDSVMAIDLSTALASRFGSTLTVTDLVVLHTVHDLVDRVERTRGITDPTTTEEAA